MILLFHILTAITSVAFATYLLVTPSRAKLRVSYALTGLTLASGTYLVVSMHANILQTCMTGLVYVGFVGVATVVAQRKLAIQPALQKTRK